MSTPVNDNYKDVLLNGILSEDINEVWKEVLPYLEKTLEYCDCKYDVKNIYNNLINKEMQLWTATLNDRLIGYAITQIIVYPTQKRVLFPFVGGEEMYSWLHFLDIVKEWAKAQGCVAIEGYGRPGWERVLRGCGVEKIHTIYRAYI